MFHVFHPSSKSMYLTTAVTILPVEVSESMEYQWNSSTACYDESINPSRTRTTFQHLPERLMVNMLLKFDIDIIDTPKWSCLKGLLFSKGIIWVPEKTASHFRIKSLQVMWSKAIEHGPRSPGRFRAMDLRSSTVN